MGRAVQNRITGYFQQAHYLGGVVKSPRIGTPVRSSEYVPLDGSGDVAPHVIYPIYDDTVTDTPVDVPIPFDPAGIIVPKPVDVYNAVPIMRTATVKTAVRQGATSNGNGDIVTPINPIDYPDVILPTLSPASNPVPTVTTTQAPPTATVSTVQVPTLTPDSSAVPLVNTTPVATVPAAAASQTSGYVNIFGMQIPKVLLWVGAGLLVLYFLFGGNKKR